MLPDVLPDVKTTHQLMLMVLQLMLMVLQLMVLQLMVTVMAMARNTMAVKEATTDHQTQQNSAKESVKHVRIKPKQDQRIKLKHHHASPSKISAIRLPALHSSLHTNASSHA